MHANPKIKPRLVQQEIKYLVNPDKSLCNVWLKVVKSYRSHKYDVENEFQEK